eukprot:GHUV01030495.1.p1 GENE.GHUV01030495.1~~GHUV01030495.1.p1  ORF type:complete len:287 (-),score=35.50 GHUV01030495.1:43-903(-)
MQTITGTHMRALSSCHSTVALHVTLIRRRRTPIAPARVSYDASATFTDGRGEVGEATFADSRPRANVLDETAEFLQLELPRIFRTGVSSIFPSPRHAPAVCGSCNCPCNSLFVFDLDCAECSRSRWRPLSRWQPATMRRSTALHHQLQSNHSVALAVHAKPWAWDCNASGLHCLQQPLHYHSFRPLLHHTLHVVLQEITTSRYAEDVVFEDPVTRFTDKNGYMIMVRALKTLFNVKFELHDVQATQPDQITTRYGLLLDPTAVINANHVFQLPAAFRHVAAEARPY